MKIALCFSGLPRNIIDTYASIRENLIIPNNIEDVFMHVWDCEDGEDIGNQFESYMYDRLDRVFMLEKYSPKWCLEEPQKSFKNSSNYLSDSMLDKYPIGEFANRFDKLSQFYSLFQSIKLISKYQKKRGFVYDMIIKLRFDLIFFSPIIVKDLDPHILHVSDFMTNMNTSPPVDDCVNDWLAIGNHNNMQKYAEVWRNLRKLLKQGVIFNPEELVAKNLKNYNIEVSPSFENVKNHTLCKLNHYSRKE